LSSPWQTLSVAFNYMSRSLLRRGKSSGGKSFWLRFQFSLWITLRDQRCMRLSLPDEGCIDYFRHSKLRCINISPIFGCFPLIDNGDYVIVLLLYCILTLFWIIDVVSKGIQSYVTLLSQVWLPDFSCLYLQTSRLAGPRLQHMFMMVIEGRTSVCSLTLLPTRMTPSPLLAFTLRAEALERPQGPWSPLNQ